MLQDRGECPQRRDGWPEGGVVSAFGFPWWKIRRKIIRPFPMDFGRKKLAHFVYVLAHLPDNPILNHSPRIICDHQNHYLHFFHPNDLGKYMRARVSQDYFLHGTKMDTILGHRHSSSP